jgi:signal transduction histidine kinase
LDAGIPGFLDQLRQIHSASRGQAANANAARHGTELLRMGFSVSQVVYGYGDVCQVLAELARERETPIATDDLRIFHFCLDDAIASAVSEYERQRDAELSQNGAERLALLAHELRNALSAALLSYSTLKRGLVGVDSSSGAVLHRSLLRLRQLNDRSLAEIRLESGTCHFERILVTDLIQELAIAAAVDADGRGISFSVALADARLEVDADRHLLMGAVQNLVQNALECTPRGGHVVLTVYELEGLVCLEVEDTCGGLPPGKVDQLSKAFDREGSDRSGLGPGLSICHASAAALRGALAVRNVPERGCIFTLKLPSLESAHAALS